MNENNKKRCLIAGMLISVILVTVFWLKGIPARQGVFTIEYWDVHSSDKDTMRISAAGPGLDLAPGKYRLQWQIDLEDETSAEIRLLNSNDVKISPEIIPLTDDNSWSEVWLDIPESVHNMNANIYCISGPDPIIHSIRLTTPRYKDHIFSITFIVMIGWILGWLSYRGYLRKNREAVVLLGAAVLFISLPALREALPEGSDLYFHLSRLANLADGLKDGQFPVRIGSFSYNRYGAITSIFYPDIFLIPFALMLIIGASLTYTIQIFFIAANIVNAYLAYLSARLVFKNTKTALCTALFFVLNSYIVYDTYMVSRIGGNVAFGFLILFYAALSEVLLGEWRYWPFVSLSAFGLFESHIITTFLAGIFASVFILLNLSVLIREKKRRRALFKAFILAVGCCAFTLVPLVECLFSGDYTSVVMYRFPKMALSLRRLLHNARGFGYLAALSAILVLLKQHPPRCVKQLYFLGMLALLLSSTLFPWTIAERYIWRILEILQFPERFVRHACSFLVICGGWASGDILKKYKYGTFMLLVVGVLFLAPVYELIDSHVHVVHTGEWASPVLDTPEYQLYGTDLSQISYKGIQTDDGVEIIGFDRFSTGARGYVNANEEGYVILPMFAFDHYRLRLDGNTVSYERGNNNRIMFKVPVGTDTYFELIYREPFYWRLAEGVSFISLIILVNVLMKNKIKR